MRSGDFTPYDCLRLSTPDYTPIGAQGSANLRKAPEGLIGYQRAAPGFDTAVRRGLITPPATCYRRLHHVTAPVVPVLMRIRRVRGLPPLGTRSQCQHNEERSEPSVPVHPATRCAYPAPAIGSIRLGSLFLTLPTRGLTGQHVLSS
jgi:hypothetical protein